MPLQNSFSRLVEWIGSLDTSIVPFIDVFKPRLRQDNLSPYGMDGTQRIKVVK